MNIKYKIDEINKITPKNLMAEEGYIYIKSLSDINDEKDLYELIYFCMDLLYGDIYGKYYNYFVNKLYEYIQRYFKIKGKEAIYSNDKDIELVIDSVQGLDLGYLEAESCDLIVETIENMKTNNVGLLFRAVGVALFNGHCFSKDEIHLFLTQGDRLIRSISEEKINSIMEIYEAINICCYLVDKEFNVSSNEYYIMKAYRLAKKMIESNSDEVQVSFMENLAIKFNKEGKKNECKEIVEYIKNNIYKEKTGFLKRCTMATLLKIPEYLTDDEIREYKDYIDSKRVEIFEDGTVDLVER